MLLDSVGVFAVAGIIGPDGGLDVGSSPGLGTQGSEECAGIHGAGADFGVGGVREETAVGGPVVLETEYGILEG